MKGFWKLLSGIRKYKRNFGLSIVSNILLSLFTVVSIPLLIPFFQILFDRTLTTPVKPVSSDLSAWIQYYLSVFILEHGKEKALLIICGVMLAIFFMKNLFRYAAMYFMAPVRNGIMYDLRKQLYDKFLELPLSFYSEEKKGSLISTMTFDVQEIEWSILNVLEAVFKSPIIMLGSVIFMLYIHVQLTLFVFVLILFTALIIGGISRSLKQKSGMAQEKIAGVTSHLEESLGAMRIIKAFGAENWQRHKFNQENTQYRNLLTEVLRRRDLSAPLSEFLGVGIVTVLLWYGSTLVFQESLAPETFFAFVFAFYQVIEPAKSFSSAYYNIRKGLAALDRIDRIMHTENHVAEPSAPVNKTTFDADIVFRNVSFRYEGSDNNALHQINISIKKGSKIALVGSSGSGKSTMVDLLPRFYDPVEGEIYLDGIDIRNLRLQDLRKMFGVVSQDALLFNDTVEDNIRFGEYAYSEEEIRQAAIAAHAHDFIAEMPFGYKTNIGDRGVKLSGGQRQRLTIARAILRNPSILILDEATSALDSESEKAVQEALSEIMEGRTAFIIAHRLSTIKNADLILVLDKGSIVEQGTHEQLILRNGLYSRLVNLQSV